MDAFAQIQAAVAAASERLAPAVVAVGRGAGLVIAPGAVLTNAHNVGDGPWSVTFLDGTVEEGDLLATDVDGDLAVVRTETGGREPVPWAATGPALGAAVLAIGAPRRGAPGRVTVGFVSAVDRPFRGPRGRRLAGVEHTAPRGRGSSGGPIVDPDGRVVGIDTHRLGGGFYLALPASAELRGRVDALVRGETRSRRRLGIAVAPAEVARQLRAAVGLEPRDGLLVREVDPAGPAAAADVRRGDLIVAVDGVTTRSTDDLLAQVDAAGAELTLTILRGTDEVVVPVALPASG
jgi:serine protease Do